MPQQLHGLAKPAPSKATFRACAGVIALILVASFVYVSQMVLNVDETFHYPLIKNLLKHDFRFNPSISTLPGYHYLVFAIASAFRAESVTAIRLISFGISVLSIGAFYLLANRVKAADTDSKTLQYIFFPLLYPFFFLIYTDVTSLMLVFLGVYLTLRQKYHLAGAIGIMACLVRQDNIVWVGFMFLLMAINLLGDMGTETSLRSFIADGRGARLFRLLAVSGATYLAAFVLFVVFVVINKGVAIGDREMHPSFVLHAANIYCLLFAFFFMFLPMNIANAPKIVKLMRRHRFAVLYMAGFFLLFMATFKIDHPYNRQRWAQWFLSNRILTFSRQSRLREVIFFLPIGYSVLSLLCTRLYAPQYYLIFPISMLQLGPEWLVDPRYYLLPCLLFLAFKEENSRPVTYTTYFMYVFLFGYFLHRIVSLEWFF
jgi:alpha-1,2-glucosyltransferase